MAETIAKINPLEYIKPHDPVPIQALKVSRWFRVEVLELNFGDYVGRPKADAIVRTQLLTYLFSNGWYVDAVMKQEEGGSWVSVGGSSTSNNGGTETTSDTKGQTLTSGSGTNSSNTTSSGNTSNNTFNTTTSNTTNNGSTSNNTSVSGSNSSNTSTSNSQSSNSNSNQSNTNSANGSSTGSSSSNSSASSSSSAESYPLGNSRIASSKGNSSSNSSGSSSSSTNETTTSTGNSSSNTNSNGNGTSNTNGTNSSTTTGNSTNTSQSQTTGTNTGNSSGTSTSQSTSSGSSTNNTTTDTTSNGKVITKNLGSSEVTSTNEGPYWFAYVRLRLKRRKMQSELIMQDMVNELTTAYNEGRKVNDDRYDEIVSLYAIMLGRTEDESNGFIVATADFKPLTDYVLGTMKKSIADFHAIADNLPEEVFKNRVREINLKFDNLLSSAKTDLVGKGLYNSTIMITTVKGIERDREMALNDLLETKMDIYIKVSSTGAEIGSKFVDTADKMQRMLKDRLLSPSEMRNNVFKWMLDFMESRKDEYPGVDQIAGAAKSLGYAETSTSNGVEMAKGK